MAFDASDAPRLAFLLHSLYTGEVIAYINVKFPPDAKRAPAEAGD